jgi:hypothetical protein
MIVKGFEEGNGDVEVGEQLRWRFACRRGSRRVVAGVREIRGPEH